MKLSFHGAAREVTGSCHLLEVAGRRILLDCGMIQGGKERHERNRAAFPFDPASIDSVILSHAHIDHSGRLPLLRKSGYRGPILTTPPTVKLAEILLTDSARIQEEDARWAIKRLEKRNKDASWVTPLYTQEDAAAVLEQLEAVPFNQPYALDGVGTLTFVRAGHILGAAVIQLDLEEDGNRRRLVFSGDLGVDDARLVGGPASVDQVDYLLIESTYGDTRRPKNEDKTEQLCSIIKRTAERGGNVVIPSFAVGRTQAVLARMNDLIESGRLDPIPVFVDSPMAIQATGVFAMFPDAYSAEARRLLRAGDEPLSFPGLEMTSTVEESKAIQQLRQPCVIISASGMATAGRIKHHLAHNISDPKSTVLFVGYQAHGTLGRHIKEGTDPVRIFGDSYGVRASVETIDGFSAHADLDGLLAWFRGLGATPRRTFAVHGEDAVAQQFAATLRDVGGGRVEAPNKGQSFEIDLAD